MATRKAATKKAPAKKATATKTARKRSTTPPSKRWSAKVKTDSTRPGPGLFKKSAKAIAAGLAKKSVSPKGPGQAMQMLSFYENRGGKNLSAERKHTLENAKEILSEKEGKSSKASGSSRAKSTGSARRSSSSKSHTRRSSRKAS